MAKKGRTLWEILTGKKAAPVEDDFYNPMRACVGSPVTVNDLDLKDCDFAVRELRAYTRTIRRKRFVFTDYVLAAKPLRADEVVRRLRVLPAGEADAAAGPQALLLRLFDEMAYSDEFHGVVTDTTGKIEVTDNDVAETFWRIHDVTSPYKAKVAVVRDVDRDGKVTMEEVETVELEYWDYWRETDDAAKQPVVQYLFVEMDKETGWFQLWRGEETDPQRVVVL